VIRTRVGYSGGSTPDPTYHKIGDHSESIQIDFDPEVISFEELAAIFWQSHNPFSKSFSRQYASILFFHTPEQEKIAKDMAGRLQTERGSRVSTEILPFSGFFLAEDYHQKYVLKGNRSVYGDFSEIYPDDKDVVNSTAAARLNGYLGGNGSSERFLEEISLLGLSPEARDRLAEAFSSMAPLK
jgi:peptide-methionine (S)-S-oxide reductase